MRFSVSGRVSLCLLLLMILSGPVATCAATAIVQALTPGVWATAGWQSVHLGVGQAVRPDYVLHTDSNGRLHLRYSDGSDLHLGPSTSVSMQDYAFTGAKSSSHMNMARGSIRLIAGAVAPQAPEGFKLTTPQALVDIRGATLDIIVTQGKDSFIVRAMTPGQRVLVTGLDGQTVAVNQAGMRVDVLRGQPTPQAARPAGTSEARGEPGAAGDSGSEAGGAELPIDTGAGDNKRDPAAANAPSGAGEHRAQVLTKIHPELQPTPPTSLPAPVLPERAAEPAPMPGTPGDHHPQGHSAAKDDSKAAPANTPVDLPANVTALFLAGMDLPPNSALEKFTQSAFYKAYKAEFAASWNRFQKPNLDKMSMWWKEKLAKNFNQNISYPFSGPDIMNVLTFFPDADNYILFGLEPVGAIPNPFTITDAERTNGLIALRKSLNNILRLNFFVTAHMAEDIKNTHFNGISAILMALLAKCGYTVVDAKNAAIDDQANLVPWEDSDAKTHWRNPPASQRIPGIEITFKKGDGKTQTVRYFNVNVEDNNLSKRCQNFIPYFMKIAPYATMLKSASYLLHNDDRKFTKIRETILNSSDFIIQDDSGIPLRYFTNKEWAVSLHGVYNKPIKQFKNKVQPDLQKAFKSSTGVLPFSYGYGYPYKQNLLTASRIQSCMLRGAQK